MARGKHKIGMIRGMSNNRHTIRSRRAEACPSLFDIEFFIDAEIFTRGLFNPLNPARIGHGVRAIESPELVAQLRASGVPLEVCPWSNVLLGVFSEADHPVAELIAAGLTVVIASDDPGIFGKSLLENYLFAAERGVDPETLATLAAASLTLRRR